MKRLLFLFVVLISFTPLAGAQAPWQYGRIVSVNKSVSSATKVWVVNTPLSDETTRYTIFVHVQDKIIVGSYELSDRHPAPPPEWVRDFPVKVQFVRSSLLVRSPTGDVQLHITQRKPAAAMKPITAEEKKQLEALDAPLPESMIGFSKSEEKTAEAPPTPQPPPSPPPPAPPTGTVTVRSTPFLSEVFVDGDSMGYTPAKIALGPGKHTFRIEKLGYRPWTKELTVTVGSELTLDATLERK